MLSDISGAEAASNADTSLLYAGEQYDSSADMYYNRARYYDPSNGRFNRTDPYAGNTQDPQSLHKYLYCHNNPVNSIDPTGNFTIISLLIRIFLSAFIIKYVVQPIILAAVILTTIYVTMKLTQGPPRTPELVSAVEKFNDVINDHHDDILQYAIDHDIENVVNKGGIPSIPKVVESYRLGLLSEYFGDVNTNFITKED